MAEVSDSGQAVASPEERLASFFAQTELKPKSVAPQQTEVSPEQPSEEPVSQEAAEEVVEDTQQEDQSPEVPEGFVELEHLGNKWHVPPDLKNAFEENRKMATKSAMELAPVRRALEIEKQMLAAAKAVEGEMSQLTAQYAQLNSYKEQAKKLDWSALTLDQKVDLDRELRNIDEQMMAVGQQINNKRQEASGRFGNAVVQAVQETEKFMAAKVPGWNEDTGKALHQYGTNLGIPSEKLVAGWFADPVATSVMWKAQQWDNLQASKPSVQNKVRTAAPVVKPGSDQVQKSVASSNYQKMRQNLKKTGSLEAAAAIFRSRMK